MTVEKTRNGDVELAYERIGPPDGTPLLLLNGSGGQMVMWPDDLLRALVDRGFQVARMDYRDTGLATHLHQYDDLPRKRRPGYTFDDVADDVVAVMDALGLPSVHLMGSSRGGNVAQVVAYRHPDRVRTVTMLSVAPSNSLWLIRPRLRTVLRVFGAAAGSSKTRDEEAAKWEKMVRAMTSPMQAAEVEHWREAARISFDRGLNPKGELRLTAALFKTGDRRPLLGKITSPALVVHGKRDGMCHWKAGKATADAIPGAKFVLYPKMGHIPVGAQWTALLDEISALAARGDAGHRPRGADTHPRR